MSKVLKNRGLVGAKQRVYPQGRWSRAEHDRFIRGLEKYGRNWLQLQKFIKSRSVAQVRSHAQKYFLNMTDDDIEAYISLDTNCKSKKSRHFFETELDNRSGLPLETNDLKKQDDQRNKVKGSKQKFSFDLLQVFKNAIEIEIKGEEKKKVNMENQEQLAFREYKLIETDLKTEVLCINGTDEKINIELHNEEANKIKNQNLLQRKLTVNSTDKLENCLETAFF